MKDRSDDTATAEHFRADPTYAAELLARVCPKVIQPNWPF